MTFKYEWMKVAMLGAAMTSLTTVSVRDAIALDIYPAKGQPPQQQAADTAECQQFAKQQSGFDPQQALSNPAPMQQPEAVRPRKRMKEEQAEQQQMSAATKQKMEAYNKAESVCLKGKGYSVG